MNKNIEKGFAKIMGKMYNEALKEAQKRDSCRYCHEPFLSLGLAKDIDSEAIVYLNVLRESNRIKFCPVCGRDLSVESYVDRTQKAQKESGEAIKKVDGLLKVKQTPAP
ncbi:hypothetical protein [Pediococcus pentosaceus]|uniref:hypothetical protein n=1 Tax=Pediococcus pentosaceus TaxID=1255 RepID=UPI0013309E52|nr:hypothetical protein [Pediococcus pentosaceus]KAF0422860.1 hypothetical protein GBO84_05975 [Pediococcus pentosaceus]